MEAFQKHPNSDELSMSYDHPMQKFETYYSSHSQTQDHLVTFDDGRVAHFSNQSSKWYGKPEGSMTSGSFRVSSSLSTASFSPNGSPASQLNSLSHPLDNAQSSPVSRSCLTDDVNDLKHKLRELESTMLGPDSDVPEVYGTAISCGSNEISMEAEKWKQMMEMISRGNLKQVLIACAKAIANGDLLTVEWLMSELRPMVSVSGDPMQRLGAYMLEGLVARLSYSGSSICKSLRCNEPTSNQLLSYMHLLYEVCPYFKFGYMSANGAIAEAMKDENKIHIIDFQIVQGGQWISLIQALGARPGGPPRICITGIDDSTSAYARGGGLDIVGQRLSRLAESCRVPFEFHAVTISASEIEAEHLRILQDEALAVNFTLMLHHIPDESVGTDNHRDRLLRLVKILSPKVVTLVEHESNTNTAPFFPRFLETLNYYNAIFESIDVTLPREHKERINVEQHCLARDIVNIIACEGPERVERYEPLTKWRSRFVLAGFKPYPLSSFINSTIRSLLDNYCDKYRVDQRHGALYLGWMDQDLVVSCAWE